MRHDLAVAWQVMGANRVDQLRAAQLTYAEVGMTRQDVLPVGYRTFRRTVPLGTDVDFDTARRDLLTWQVQQRAGLRVTASGEVAEGVVADIRLGIGLLSVLAPCRVVYVIDEQARCGFAYGTLPGHPESGEECFFVERTDVGALTLTVAAFSRPATMLSKLAGPVGTRLQDFMTGRYLRTLS